MERILRFDRAQALVLGATLIFWTLALWNLDRFPPLHEDEPWILSVALKFFSQGILGSDLFTGFYGMEQHYVLMPPLFPVLQGIAMGSFGVGISQMRWLPAACGTLTLPLTFSVARKLMNASVGVVAVVLLLLWQWTPGNLHFFGSGVPLLDIARIARYDILAVPLGLGALWMFLQAETTGKRRYDFLSGIFSGFAALAHVYGLFWVAAFVVILWLDLHRLSRLVLSSRFALLLVGTLLPLTPWFTLIYLNARDFLGQSLVLGQHFDVLNPAFYWNKMLSEGNRYFPGGRDLAAATTVGVWLLLIGVLAALFFLIVRTARQRNPRAHTLLVPALLFPLLFALLVQSKAFVYLASVVPLFAIAMAWSAVLLLQSHAVVTRTAAWILFLTLALQGGAGMARMEHAASAIDSPRDYFAQLAAAIPQDARTLGHPQYFLPLIDRDYRSFVLPFYQSDPSSKPAPISFRDALAQISPNYVLMDPAIIEVFSYRDTPYNRTASDQFWEYMNAHQARIVAEVQDNYGTPIQVYRLNP